MPLNFCNTLHILQNDAYSYLLSKATIFIYLLLINHILQFLVSFEIQQKVTLKLIKVAAEETDIGTTATRLQAQAPFSP